MFFYITCQVVLSKAPSTTDTFPQEHVKVVAHQQQRIPNPHPVYLNNWKETNKNLNYRNCRNSHCAEEPLNNNNNNNKTVGWGWVGVGRGFLQLDQVERLWSDLNRKHCSCQFSHTLILECSFH